MKILHVCNYSLNRLAEVYYNTDRKITSGLIRNGHFVYDFSYNDVARDANMFGTKRFGIGKMNQALIKTAAMLRPELLLLGHTQIVKPETLGDIRRLLPETKIAQWWVDPFTSPKKIATIRDKFSYLDALFVNESPFAIRDFLKASKGRFPCAHIPFMCDASIEPYRAFDNTDYEHDLIFIGRGGALERDAFVSRIKRELPDLRFHLAGQSRDTLVFSANYMDLFANTKSGLNYDRILDEPLHTSDRLLHMAANGLLVFSPRIPELNRLFTEDEIVYFDDFDDFRRKLSDYMSNDEKRIAHAKRGWEKAHRAFNSTRITKFILEVIFNKPFSENYEWSDYVLGPADDSS